MEDYQERNYSELQDYVIPYGIQAAINGEGIDPYHMLVETLTYWLSQAEEAADTLGISHRGFLVGSVGIAHDPERQQFKVFFGGNNSPYKGAPKDCAEKTILDKMTSESYPELLAIIVAGPVQPDQESGLDTHTLHPCGICRENHRDHPAVDPDRTIIITTEKPPKIPQITESGAVTYVEGEPTGYEVHTFAELDKRHMTAGLQAKNTAKDHDAFYVEATNNYDIWEQRRRTYGEFLFRLNGIDRIVDSVDDRVDAVLYALRSFPRTR